MLARLIYSKKARQRGGIFSVLLKIILGVVMLYLAYLLFKYAAAKGDWDFITQPLKNLWGLI